MKNKKLYEAPDAEQLCLKMEHSFCESALAPDYTLRTDFTWEDEDL